MSKYVGKIVTNQASAGYSVFFDGSGDRLSLVTNTALDLTGDFTFECWIYPTVLNTYHIIFDTSLNGTAGGNMTELWIVAPDSIQYYARGSVLLSGTGVVTNRWQHVAITKAGTTQRLFLNGIIVASTTSSTQPNTGYTWAIGDRPAGAGSAQYPFTGNISDLRIVKGTALYTANFTPPTQLLNVTNTSLLTCNSPAIVDQSSNALPIITEGNAAVSTFTPFAAYNPAPTSSNPLTPAPGVWTLDEALQYTQQGVWPSYAVNAIEDVFSTFLYTGNGSTQTVNNGIDLATYGGLVWNKVRSGSGLPSYHYWVDTARGRSSGIGSNSTDAQYISGAGNDLASFTTTGYTLGPLQNWNAGNGSGNNIVSWTFRKQAKFFDVVTYTGNGVAGRQIAHNLGSAPGCIFVKKISATGDWLVYHRSRPAKYFYLNSTAAEGDDSSGVIWGNGTTAVAPTSTNFTVNALTAFPAADINANGQTYVAYLFAHNAGGFGPAGTDNVISCGSFTYSAGTEVNLGYEPQWLVIKRTDITTAGSWYVVDVARGWTTDSNAFWVTANTTDGDASGAIGIAPTATGFRVPTGYGTGSVYIYIAIRRGPMRPPSIGTSVFSPQLQTPTGSGSYVMAANSGFSVDWLPTKRPSNIVDWFSTARLTNNYLSPNTTAAEGAYTYGFDLMQGVSAAWDASSTVSYAFRRAPGFMDVVCYTGTGANRTVSHNLTIPPELMIVKKRQASAIGWIVYSAALGATERVVLNLADAKVTTAIAWNSTAPTSTVFSLGTATEVNGAAETFVAYLFATVGGVSKVGSYTGTGTTQQINCGFTNGSRFVMIKRTDSTGDWYVWDSARGIVAGNDPYLLMNSSAAEVTNTDYVDTYSLGFEISSTAPAAINANGGTYIFLAIA
jgi:hypothetical protein